MAAAKNLLQEKVNTCHWQVWHIYNGQGVYWYGSTMHLVGPSSHVHHKVAYGDVVA